MTAVVEEATTPEVARHSWFEDVVGLATGSFLASLGVYLLHSVHAASGGTAGLVLLLGYAFHLSPSLLLVLVNLPFMALAVWKKGWVFAIRTVLTLIAISLLYKVHDAGIVDLHLHRVYAVLVGHLLIGVSIVILVRHRSSMGGFGVIALLAQERLGWRAGWVQLGLDLCVLALSLTAVSLGVVLLSVVGDVLLNLILALNHREGRYLGR